MNRDNHLRVSFNGNILVLGCGSVAQCLLPLLLKHIDGIAPRITVLDKEARQADITSSVLAGVSFERLEVTPDNYADVLSQRLQPGDLLIDLAWNIETTALLDWSHRHGVLFINTSVEEWDPYDKVGAEQTLYMRQMKIRRLVHSWGQPFDGPTAVLDHGANPGLVSHFTKAALIQIAEKIIAEKPADARVPRLQSALNEKSFNQLAMLAGVKVIHISERDTQVTDKPKRVNEFVNTWSIEGFHEEGIAPAEIGWGTHEKRLPWDAVRHQVGPRHQIFLDSRRGMDTWVRSWVPGGQIHGMVIRHGEAFSLTEALSVADSNRQVVYRPTVHYAYCPTDSAVASLHELRMRDLKLQDKLRILRDDVTDGADILGCLLMGHDFGAWWIGSLLDIHETRRLVPGQNPTTLQVASSMLGAIAWMLRNPNRGVNLPDYLPHDEVLEVARPYLGPIVSEPVDWRPDPDRELNDEQQWQFESFLVDYAPTDFDWLDEEDPRKTKVRIGREPEYLPTGVQGTTTFMAPGWI